MKCLDKVKEALLTVSDNVGHYEAMKKDDRYIVWAEDGAGDRLGVDNHVSFQAVQGTIDLYTKTENDPLIEQIQEALKTARICFYLNSVQYEDESKLIHYEWVFEVA